MEPLTVEFYSLMYKKRAPLTSLGAKLQHQCNQPQPSPLCMSKDPRALYTSQSEQVCVWVRRWGGEGRRRQEINRHTLGKRNSLVHHQHWREIAQQNTPEVRAVSRKDSPSKI